MCARAQDIAAIEARNNRLERQARHNSALAEALDTLLDRLVLPPATERVLATANFTYAMCAGAPPLRRMLPLERDAARLQHVPCKSLPASERCTWHAGTCNPCTHG